MPKRKLRFEELDPVVAARWKQWAENEALTEEDVINMARFIQEADVLVINEHKRRALSRVARDPHLLSFWDNFSKRRELTSRQLAAEEQLEKEASELAEDFTDGPGKARALLHNLIVKVAKNYLESINEERAFDVQGDALDRGL